MTSLFEPRRPETAALLVVVGLIAACDSGSRPGGDVPTAGTEAALRSACASCHQFPPPDILPRSLWADNIATMYELAAARGVDMQLAMDSAIAWYGSRAPEQLPPTTGRTNAGFGPVNLQVADWRPPNAPPPADIGPGTTHVRFARLFGGPGDDLLVSDAQHGQLYAIKPYAFQEGTIAVGQLGGPGRVDVGDLDGDGLTDVVAADLGSFMPSNDLVGSIVWLRRTSEEGFEPRVLADNLGRVADLRADDVNGDGRMDVVVAVFGWRENGQVMWLENVAGQGADLEFVRHVLDPRPGSVDVRVADMNGDGRQDIVALMAQEYEQVMVYWAEDGGYRPEAVYSAPHPSWGFSGMEVVDFTGDGRLDVVMTNGDALDTHLVKPDHGVGFLENLGDGTFSYHHLTYMYGAFRAAPVDLKGDGRMGLLVSAHLLPFMVSNPTEPVEAIIWLERVGPTQLVRRVLKGDTPYHLTMDVGDFTGEGRMDFAVGWMDFARFIAVNPDALQDWEPVAPWVSFWRNDGLVEPATDPSQVEVIDWSR